jgi:hypothetical protein
MKHIDYTISEMVASIDSNRTDVQTFPMDVTDQPIDM